MDLLTVGLLSFLVGSLSAQWAAYRCGAYDAYYFARDPHHHGGRKAGRIIYRGLSHMYGDIPNPDDDGGMAMGDLRREDSCDDVDVILAKLGLTVEQARTEGGSLRVQRICNHIQETFDALEQAHNFGASMSDRANDKGGEAVAVVVSAYGDPESFGEREIVAVGDISKIPYNTPLYTHPPRATAVEDVRKDAEEWGDALNEAAWVFIEESPEKSALLFNTAKKTLRSAILKYLDALSAQRGDVKDD